MQIRALITAFDAYLQRKLDVTLHEHIPPRVLPISTKPPGDFEFLVDKEFNYVNELLQPGRRARDEARARIRSMLAMEAIVTDEVEISERDIDRIEKAMRGGAEFVAVFPRLATVGTTTEGEGVNLVVQFTKKQGAPVHYVGGMILPRRRRSARSTCEKKSICSELNSPRRLVSVRRKRKYCAPILALMMMQVAVTFLNSVPRKFRAFPTMLCAE
ncbi:hypothetical protein [Rhizobium sp. T1473]|uniref:hypothetical protein n=1 Tax=unclassified Rhizobium TaxID=2613769 RepID=UPI001AAE4184|nr:hypothetical protein [Rhizobium sp. T1473]MCA0806417.1 hypothetical protein [Rhizobium sp. T1473]